MEPKDKNTHFCVFVAREKNIFFQISKFTQTVFFLYLGSIWAVGLGSIWALFGLYLGFTLGLVVFGLIQVHEGLDKYLDQRIARGRLRPRSDAAPFANGNLLMHRNRCLRKKRPSC